MFKRSSRRTKSIRGAALLLIGILGILPAMGDEPADAQHIEENGTVERSAPVTPFLFEGDLRDLPPVQRWKPGDPIKEIPRRAYVDPSRKTPPPLPEEGVDRLLELQRAPGAPATAVRAFGTPDRNFDGQGFSGVNPPDTTGEVGPNHFIQMINAGGGATVVVYDKALPTPNVLASFSLDSLGSGSCATGLGDPIVLYDRDADRWLLTEFSSSGNNVCMYVSQTGDPVSGGWNFYGFTAPSFPDYPKYGVWATDANGGPGSYIVTTNETSSGVYAMDRGAMLAGLPATFQRFTIADLPGFPFNAVTPADSDGSTPPPTGAPGVIMRQRDTEVHSGPAAPEDVLEIWHFDVDWSVPGNTTLTQLADIDVAEFSSELCGLSAFACFQQPGSGTTLDPLREVIMNRLQYRNFGDYEVLVGNFVTDVDGTERGGVRWFELRRTGGASGGWVLHQEGLVSPDGDSRFMAGSAMDQSGNIAVAYNVTSTTTFPGLRFTGRLADDAAGSTLPESSIVEGTASNSSNRYGDYAAMGVDPEDDCTFWFTGEYNTSGSWSTRIASFRFDACGCDLFPLPLSLTGGNNGDNRIDLAWGDSELAEVVEYRVLRSRTPGGPYTVIDTVDDTSLGLGSTGSYTYADETVSGGIAYYYVVRASDGGACTSDPSNEISDTATGICLLAPLFDGIETVTTPNGGICTLNLTWNAAAAECSGPIRYEVYRSTDPDFSPTPLDLVADDVTGTSYSDQDILVSGTQYAYIVRAVDEFNGVSETNTAVGTAVPFGLLQAPLFVDDAGDTGAAQLAGNGPWAVDATGGNEGPGVYTTGDYGNNVCAQLTMPAIALGTGNELQFWSRYEIENSYDKGEVQISTDGGTSWSRLEVGYPGTSSNASDSCGLPTGQYFTGTNTSWARYSADLSPYDGQTVSIRFTMSSDGSVTAGGWFIDDIAIVNQPASCATASACPENPIVNVTPDGPLGVCALSLPELSAQLDGGTGPFTFQWYRDGAPIPGADAATYQVVDAATHAYNVRVSAAACADEVADGAATVVAAEATARFNGLVSASSAGQETCGVDLAWDAASTVCPGPVVYDVYRSTSPDVELVPGNRVASGLALPGFSDSVGLVSGQTYHYRVQAVELSTGQADGNVVERSIGPSGPVLVAFSDDGGDTGAAQLTSETPWSAAAAGGNVGPGVYTTGAYTSSLCASVETPTIAITAGSELSFWSRHEIESGWDKGEVQISVDGGASWDRVEVDYPFSSTQSSDSCGLPTGTYFTSDAPTWAEYTADLSAWAGQTASLRWQLSTDGSVTDNGWWIDEIEVLAGSACLTGAAGPPPAPDGRNATTPLRGDRVTVTGDVLDVTWDVTSCVAGDYNLLYGDLSGVSTLSLGGSECGMGTGGAFTWNGVPTGDLFFLVVGVDGTGTESSWGLDGVGIERNGASSSGECGVVAKEASTGCP